MCEKQAIQCLMCFIMPTCQCPTPSPTLGHNYHASYTPCLAASWYTDMYSLLWTRKKFCLKEKKSTHIKLSFTVHQMNSCPQITHNNGQSVINSSISLFINIQVSLALQLVMFQSVYSCHDDMFFLASSHYRFLSFLKYIAFV